MAKKVVISIIVVVVIAFLVILFLSNTSFRCSVEKLLGKGDGCYMSEAIKNKDVTICDKIKGPIENCYLGVAYETKNKSICEKMKQMNLCSSQYCWTDLAVYYKDPVLCPEYDIDGCFINVGECYRQVANTGISIAECDKIKDYPYNCIDGFARTINDTTICKDLSSQEETNSCCRVIAIINNDSKICDNII